MSRRPLRALLPLAACLAVLAGMSGAGAQTTSPAPVTVGTPAQKTAALVSPAVVYIEQHWKAWVRVPKGSSLQGYFTGYVNDGYAFEWSTRCTGFVVNPNGYVVTAGHCVDPGEKGARDTALRFAVQWLIDKGYIYKKDFQAWLDEGHLLWGVEGSEKGSDPDLEIFVQRGVAAGGQKAGDSYAARLVDYSPWSEGDGALLKIEATDLPTVLLAPTSEITVGTDVLSVGYPGSTDQVTDTSYEPTFKDGQINAEKTREGGLLPVYEISAAMSGGMSGGPTVNLNGEVVGVNSFGIVGETEAFNFITPASIVTEMLAQNGVTNELGPIDVAYRAGLDAYFQGDYKTAIDKFDEVLALAPTHQQAQDWKVEASKALADQTGAPSGATGSNGGQTPADKGGGFPVIAIIGIVAALVVIGGALFFMSRRKGGPKAQQAQLPQPPLQVVGAPAPQTAEAARSIGFQPTAPVAPQVTTPPVTAPPVIAPGPTPSGTSAEHQHFCPNCGFKLETDAHFCPSCGHKIEA